MRKYLPPHHKLRPKTLDSTGTVDFTHFRRTVNRYCVTVSVYKIAGVPDIQTSKRHATIELLQAIHVAHKHELIVLTMTRILSKTSRLFEFIDFCLSGMLADKHGYFNCRH